MRPTRGEPAGQAETTRGDGHENCGKADENDLQRADRVKSGADRP